MYERNTKYDWRKETKVGNLGPTIRSNWWRQGDCEPNERFHTFLSFPTKCTGRSHPLQFWEIWYTLITRVCYTQSIFENMIWAECTRTGITLEGSAPVEVFTKNGFFLSNEKWLAKLVLRWILELSKSMIFMSKTKWRTLAIYKSITDMKGQVISPNDLCIQSSTTYWLVGRTSNLHTVFFCESTRISCTGYMGKVLYFHFWSPYIRNVL